MDAEQAAQFNLIPATGAPEGQRAGTYDQQGNPVESGPSIDGQALAGMAIPLIFGMLADRRGDHWRLTGSEQTELVKAAGACIDYYMPPVGGGPLAQLAVCGSIALGPRLLKERQLIEQRKKAEEAARRERRQRAEEAGEADSGNADVSAAVAGGGHGD